MKYKVRISNFVFGVPAQIVRYYNPDQFEILGHDHDLPGGTSLGQFVFNNVGVYKRILIKNK